MISQFQRRLPGLTYIPTKFTARYEFIDTYESGDPIIGTLCDRRFDSIKSSTGTIRSSRNLFFYGRGGNRDVSCSYYFNGRVGEKLILKITSLKLTSASQLCRQSTNDPIQTYSCISPLNPSSSSSQSISTSPLSTLTKTKSTFGLRGKDNQLKQSSYSSKGFTLTKTRASASLSSVSSSSLSSSTLRVYDSVTNELLSVACFCDSTNLTVNLKTPIILNLIGSQSVLNFTIIGMNFNQDYNDFHFEGKYEFIDNNYCSSHSIDSTQTDLESEGSISYQVPSDLDWSTNSQFKCRWIFIWYPNKFVSLRFDGYRPKRDQRCEGKNRIVIYWDSPWRPMATVCARNSSIVQRVGGNGNDQVETINLSLSLMQSSSSSFGTSFPSSQSNSSTSMKRRPSSSSSSSSISSSSLSTSWNHNDNNHLSSLLLPQDVNRFQWKSQDNLYPSSAISFFNSSSLRVIIEIIAETPSAHFNFHWLTHKSPPPTHQKAETSETLRNTDCLYKCPELNFCLSPDLLCDGVKHCPSGYDESNVFCSSSSLIATLFFTLIIMILAVGGIFYSIIRSLRRRSSQSTSIHDIGSCLPPTTIFGSLEETASGSIGRESSSVSSGSFSNFTHLTSSSTNRPPSLTSKYMLPNHQLQLQNQQHHHGSTLSTIGEFEFHSSLGGPLIPSGKLNTQSTDFSSLLSSSSPSSSEHSANQRPLTLSITNLKNDSYCGNVNFHPFDNPNNSQNYTSHHLRKHNNKHTLSYRHLHQHSHYQQSSINTIQSPTNSTFSPHHNSQTTSFTSSSSTSTS
ncbi:uncharacterized protein LOC128388688 [Panonychus citri]|uniref:uncharacterized protein LOC128388688 n=1 Tax=Panonychus citri TaxID=50023 RepID=UPI002307806E|nr:uncharacterized protein LOC128388688 [Panonychus citri]